MYKIANIVFNPFINDSRVLKESISLVTAGYELELIAHGDKGLPKEELKDGFKIVRLSYLDRKVTKTKKDKLKIYLSWMKQVVEYVKEFDILHCNDLNTLPIAFIVKKFYNKNIKIVYDAHEYETEMNGLYGIQKFITKIVERYFIKHVDATITVSDGIANEYVKLYDIKKPSIVLNTPELKEIKKRDIFRETFDISKEQTIFLYQGSLSRGRGIKEIIETFKILDKKSVIIFMGYGELESLIIEESNKYKNIYFHKAVNPDILLEYTCSTDFGISTIEDTCLSYHYCLPNKMFEYIMAEVPVIVSNLPEMKSIVKKFDIGIVVKENNILGLKTAIVEAIKMDKEKIKTNLQKAKETYNWEKQEKVLLELYKEIQIVK